MRYCSLCGSAISAMDFYFESHRGQVCSTCLVMENPPREEVVVLFSTSGKDKASRDDREMDVNEVRQVVWSC